MLPTQTQRKLPGSLLSTRHTSEKFCSVSHTAWRILYCLLTIINQDGQILAISALISSAGTLQSISNARPMKGEPGLINQLPSCHWYWVTSLWDSLCTSTKSGYLLIPSNENRKSSLKGLNTASKEWRRAAISVAQFTNSSVIFTADFMLTDSQLA